MYSCQYYSCIADIDECEYDHVHACEHFCNNTEGSYECSCEEGFDLGDNNHTCIGKQCAIGPGLSHVIVYRY